MSTRRVELRMKVELAEWADEYAAERGSTRTAVIEAALASLREDARSGVPDLGRVSIPDPGATATRLPKASARAGRVRRAEGVPSASRRVVEPSPAGVVDGSVSAAVPASRAELFRRATQGGS